MRRQKRDPFRRSLRWYPAWWRRANGAVFVDSLRDHADHEQRAAPSPADRFSAFVNGTGLRLDARMALWASLLTITLGALSWVGLLAGVSGGPGPGWLMGLATMGVAPMLAAVALVAIARERRWVTPPRALLVLPVLLIALLLAALTQVSWAWGFRLADANQPLTGLAGAWGVLFVSAWVVGAAGVGLGVDGLFYRTRWPWFARLSLAVFAGAVAAPALGLSLINPTVSTVSAAVVAVVALRTISGRRVRLSPASDPANRSRPSNVRGLVRWLSVVSAGFGVVGVVYAFTGAGWSAGATDTTIAMGQGITILLAAAIPLLAAIALIVPTRHGRPAVWGPLGLVVLSLTALAIAYVYAPGGLEMALWMGVSAALGGAAVAWWCIPRLRGTLALRVTVGAAVGLGYAALFGMTVVPMLAFAVPIAAIVLVIVFSRPRPKGAAIPRGEQAATSPAFRITQG